MPTAAFNDEGAQRGIGAAPRPQPGQRCWDEVRCADHASLAAEGLALVLAMPDLAAERSTVAPNTVAAAWTRRPCQRVPFVLLVALLLPSGTSVAHSGGTHQQVAASIAETYGHDVYQVWFSVEACSYSAWLDSVNIGFVQRRLNVMNRKGTSHCPQWYTIT